MVVRAPRAPDRKGAPGEFSSPESTSFVLNQQRRELISDRKRSHELEKDSPELPTVSLTWHAGKHKVHKLHHQRYVLSFCADLFLLGIRSTLV